MQSTTTPRHWRWLLLIGPTLIMLAGATILVGYAVAQTTDSGTGSSGTGTYTGTSGTSGGTSGTGTSGTGTTTDPQTTCTSQGYKWCPSSSGSSYCSYSTGSCPAYDSASCSAQGGEWCPGMSGATGWCASGSGSSCPVNDKATCEAKGRQWCSGTSGGSDWCAATGQQCPVSDAQTTCTSSGGKWCKNSDGVSGYCSTGSSPCPAYTSADCSTQGGEWCAYTSGSGGTTSGSSGSSGWCATPPGACPIYDQATCVAKSRKWCASSGGASGSSGYCTSSATESCPSTTPTPTPTPTPTYTWPSAQTECEEYYGKWCAATGGASYGGSCMMGIQTCYTPTQSGQMRCWDNSVVTSPATCPTMPTTQSSCQAAGKNWCTSASAATAASSGWCSAEPCMAMPPSGQMTCPDGKSFAARLSGCPKKGSATPDTRTCADGSKVAATADCPAVYTCPNGTVVKTADQCPKTEDPITVCLNKGGTWCTDKTGAKSGWCAVPGQTCSQVVPPPEPKPEPKPEPEPKPIITELTRQQVRQLNSEKRGMARELKTMEKFFKKVKDEAMLAKIAALQDKISAFTPKDSTSFETMNVFREEVELLRDAYQDALEKEGEIDERGRDQEFQRRALRDMQRGIRQFERYLTTLENKIKKLEKDKITVDPKVKEVIATARDLAKRVKNAKTYDEVKDLTEQLPEVAAQLNELLPELEQLSRLPRIVKVLSARLQTADAARKEAVAVSRRFKLEVVEELGQMATLIAEAKAALGEVRGGAVPVSEVADYLEENVLDKLGQAESLAEAIRAVANVQRFLNKASADLTRFTRRLTARERAGEDLSEVRSLLAEAQQQLAEVRTLAGKRRTAEVNVDLIEGLGKLGEQLDELAEALGLVTPGPFEQELKKVLETGGEKFDQFKVNDLEKLIVSAYRRGNFFRLAPTRALTILAE
ncbi:MAG: hypothetical protein HYV42_01290 [Candidatus Magasanikbacteria bacterium]|nr:hypothetical protein [Candidatus Magasanikbacteria bacterium]